MEVILKKDVKQIGKAGAVIKVKDGFARNFLLPNGLAVEVNADNLRIIEEERKKKELLLENSKNDALALSDRLAKLSLTMPVLTQADEKLYGSIGQIEIFNALKAEGFDIDKSKILLDEPIKALGIYEVEVKLHPDVITKLKIWVVKK